MATIAVTNQDELGILLDNQTTQIGKIALEQSNRFDALTKTIAELTAAINTGALKPELVVKAQAVQDALDNLDAAIPDAPTPVPDPVPTPV